MEHIETALGIRSTGTRVLLLSFVANLVAALLVLPFLF